MNGRAGCGLLALVALVSLLIGGAAGGAAGVLVPRFTTTTAARVADRPPSAVADVTVRLTESSAVIQAAEKIGPSVVTLQTSSRTTRSAEVTGVGSGVIFDKRGFVLTNKHVVDGATAVSAVLTDGRRLSATIVGTDPLTDLAVVKLPEGDYTVAEFGDSAALKPGQMVIAVGSPLGTYQNSVTAGIVSAVNRTVDVDATTTLYDLIQTDAAISRGNSGGPLVNAIGQVVGINTIVAQGGANIGFSIAINSAKPVMQSVVESNRIIRPWIGISYQPVTQELAALQKLPIDYGVYVFSAQSSQPAVQAGSPAAKAGIRNGDIVTEVNNQRLDANRSLSDVIQKLRAGDTVPVKVFRDGQEIVLNLTLAERQS